VPDSSQRIFRVPTPRTLRALGLAAVVLLFTFVFAASVFLYVMYDGTITVESLIDASHYAMQTVTTVGYGTWETASSGERFDSSAILVMRGWSILFMGLGSIAFAVFMGVVIAILMPPESYTGS
jgi:hypothetical protein